MRISCWLGTILVLCVASGRVLGQGRITSDDVARQHNTKIQAIQEEIDTLRAKLRNTSLPMAEVAKIIAKQGKLQRQADELWETTQADIDKVFKNARDDIIGFNADTRRLEFQSAIVGSKADLLNNVGKYPTKAAFDQNRARMSEDWQRNYGDRLKVFGEDFSQQRDEIFRQVKDTYGIDLRTEGYARFGTSNPYNNEVYYKYYGPDGKAKWIQWKDDAEGWKKYQKDVETTRRRRLDEKGVLEKESKGIKQLKSDLEVSRRSVARDLNSLAQAVKKAQPDEPILGAWKVRLNSSTATLIFNKDGTFSYSGGGSTLSQRGSWTKLGNSITMMHSQGIRSTIELRGQTLYWDIFRFSFER